MRLDNGSLTLGSSERFIRRVETCGSNGCEWHGFWGTPLADAHCYTPFLVRLASCVRANRRYDVFVIKTGGTCHTSIPSLMVSVYSRLRLGSSYRAGNCYLFDGRRPPVNRSDTFPNW